MIDNYYRQGTIFFDKVYFNEGYSLVGPKEKQGRLGETFDFALENDKFGEKTFEKAERKMFIKAIEGLLNKSNVNKDELDVVLGGDLLNQIISVAFAMRDYHVPFLGLYNACGTYVESLICGSILVDEYLNNALCVAGSHFSTAERQYRYPLELGVLRSPVTQWTATGVGCSLLTNKPNPNRRSPKIVSATIGRVTDFGIMDVNNMGAAMAPAAADTFTRYFQNTGKSVKDFDLLVTGDLGILGREILIDLMKQEGYNFNSNYIDCGAELYFEEQKTYMGGSGAACSAIVTNGLLLDRLTTGKVKSILLVGTGALMSPTTSFQGDTIPCIAHCVEIRC